MANLGVATGTSQVLTDGAMAVMFSCAWSQAGREALCRPHVDKLMDDDPTQKVGRRTKQCIAVLYCHGFRMTKPRLISIKLHVIVSIPGYRGNDNEKE